MEIDSYTYIYVKNSTIDIIDMIIFCLHYNNVAAWSDMEVID